MNYRDFNAAAGRIFVKATPKLGSKPERRPLIDYIEGRIDTPMLDPMGQIEVLEREVRDLRNVFTRLLAFMVMHDMLDAESLTAVLEDFYNMDGIEIEVEPMT